MTDDGDEDALVRSVLRENAEYFRAPAALRATLQQQIRMEPVGSTWYQTLGQAIRARGLLPMGTAFAAGALAGAVLLVALQFQATPIASDATLVALLEDHARSVVTASTIEVASSDQHTVKPWLSTTLGYSPAVVDLAAYDFPLRGARRGFLGGMPVAVMVYGYKKHEIDVYVLQSALAGPSLYARTLQRDGYTTASWKVAGLTYVAISDLDAQRLRGFAARLAAEQDAAPH